MSDIDADDADVPALAVAGLNEATRRAMLAGEVVLIRDGKLVKVRPDGSVEVIRTVPGRQKWTAPIDRLEP
jgi:hypothetical protein